MPQLQDRTEHGLHWFDPFGSVEFKNFCNVPPIDNHANARRYVFWDQEPLHKETVDHTLSQFVNMFDLGKRHLITSELDSEYVDYAVDTYGFDAHYYFFHGWAALDWFRGYDRSFLMPAPELRNITKTFTAPNRIIGGRRQHRLLLLYHLFKNNLTNNWISCPAVCPGENISIAEASQSLVSTYADIQQVFSAQSLPLDFPNEKGHPMHSNRLSLFDQVSESLLYVVTETVAQGRRQHLTEKTFKPICMQIPFVIVGTAGCLEYLKSYGFQTFGNLWDESYDTELDDVQRIEKISKLLKDLDNLTVKERQQLYTASIPIVQHNFNHFYQGGFENILWRELTHMMQKLF